MKLMEAPSPGRRVLVSLLGALGGILPGHRDWPFPAGTPSDSLLGSGAATRGMQTHPEEEKFIH